MRDKVLYGLGVVLTVVVFAVAILVGGDYLVGRDPLDRLRGSVATPTAADWNPVVRGIGMCPQEVTEYLTARVPTDTGYTLRLAGCIVAVADGKAHYAYLTQLPDGDLVIFLYAIEDGGPGLALVTPKGVRKHEGDLGVCFLRTDQPAPYWKCY